MNPPKLKAVYRLDSIPLSATYWTKEGYLKDEPIVTSVGIFEYLNQDGLQAPGTPAPGGSVRPRISGEL